MSASIWINETPLPRVTAKDAVDTIANYAGLRAGHQVTRAADGSVEISRKHTTGVILACCILLFPLGLLALLARPTETIQVSAKEVGEGSAITVTGTGDASFVQGVQTILAEGAQ